MGGSKSIFKLKYRRVNKGLYKKGKTAEMQEEQDFGAVFRSYKSAEWR